MPGESALDAVRGFADAVMAKFAAPVAMWPEDQLKAPVEVLIKAVGGVVAPRKAITVITEAPRDADAEGEAAGTSRVDMAVAVTGALNGHVELKAPGKGADPTNFKGRDKEQWDRFRQYPNLIYTDGNEWARFETGERIGPLVRISEDIKIGSAGVQEAGAAALVELLRPFLLWDPIPPRTSKGVADMLAPLCRVLRDTVLDGLGVADSALAATAADLRRYLVPDVSDAEIADTYAQTVTYALVIGRFEGAHPLSVESARSALRSEHSLLSQVLGVLADPAVAEELGTTVQLLLRVIGSIEPSRITRNRGENPWLYFYEEFLGAYDPALRKRVGAYYTPRQVVHAQVRLVSELLTGDRLGKSKTGGGFADPGVIILDPAAGTGTYPLAVLEHAASSVPANRLGQVGSVVSDVAANLYAFEIMAGPYSVAHLRLSQEIADRGGATPAKGVQVFLANTLDSHEAPHQGVFPAMYREVGREREEARRVKADKHVVVCVGNPPYFRGKATGGAGEGVPGGWVQWRVPPTTETVATKAPANGAAQQPRSATRRVHTPGVPGILEDFLAPARDAGLGGHLKNLYNDYVYFWRWALWKVFEHAPTAGSPPGAGVVSFITASSYLRGPAFSGMRQHMRASFDELWIIDLGGDNKGARTSDNVFAIETPVCIAIGVRYGAPDPTEPAKTHYTSLIDGSRREKYEQLDAVSSFADFEWRECMSGWQAPFLPADNATYFGWPELADLFPWQTNGLSFFRSWPIGETRTVLEQRWAALIADLPVEQRTSNALQNKARLQQQRKELFKESRDRRVDKSYPALDGISEKAPALADLPAGAPPPPIERIAFRSLDRQWAMLDNRVGDYLRPELRQTVGDQQLFLTSLGLADVLGRGPAAIATALLPDYHVFNGRGGQHVVPLWRDVAGLDPNVTTGLLDALGNVLGRAVSAGDLFAYCYGILSANAYVHQFWDELTIPGLRVPITADPDLFSAAVDTGRHMIWLHTYGERFTPDGQQPGQVPEGTATYAVGVPNHSGAYPTTFSYDPSARQLHVGAGRFDEIAPEVWDYSISGWQVVDRWLGYRMPVRAGKKSSKLDDIRPERWPDPDGEELLSLLWIIEHTLAAQAGLHMLLTEVLSGSTIKAADLPAPSLEDREPPPTPEADEATDTDGLFAD